jgi:hypothetical protein
MIHWVLVNSLGEYCPYRGSESDSDTSSRQYASRLVEIVSDTLGTTKLTV